MQNESKPDPKDQNPGYTILWLFVGLAPIPILLSFASSTQPNRSLGGYFFLLCVVCNLLGGMGCVRGVKDGVARILLGLLLGGVFFMLSIGIALFQACSHMHIG